MLTVYWGSFQQVILQVKSGKKEGQPTQCVLELESEGEVI